MYDLSALDELEPKLSLLEDESDFALPESYLHNKMSLDSTEDVAGDEESEGKSEKSETPSIPPTPTMLQVVKEVELPRTRNSTPARQLQESSNTSESTTKETTKRTQPKRTRASTSTVETPSSSPSTPTPGTKRRMR